MTWEPDQTQIIDSLVLQPLQKHMQWLPDALLSPAAMGECALLAEVVFRSG